MLHKNRITRSLCAVMLCAGLLLSGLLSVPAEAAPGDETPPIDVNDVYAIDIEFGNLSFYYDYGVWDVNDMRYEASATSTNPASGTVAGYPGWYGFDQISNKISVKNSGVEGKAVTVVLEYRALTAGELTSAGANAIVSGVSMTVLGAAQPSEWQANAATVSAKQTVEGFIHLSGEPTLAGGSVYDSATMQPIGMLILKIESPM